jgi:hypothetical protein
MTQFTAAISELPAGRIAGSIWRTRVQATLSGTEVQ